MPHSRGSFQPMACTRLSRITGGFLTTLATWEAREFWSGWPISSPGDVPSPGIELGPPALQLDSLPAELPGKPFSFTII